MKISLTVKFTLAMLFGFLVAVFYQYNLPTIGDGFAFLSLAMFIAAIVHYLDNGGEL